MSPQFPTRKSISSLAAVTEKYYYGISINQPRFTHLRPTLNESSKRQYIQINNSSQRHPSTQHGHYPLWKLNKLSSNNQATLPISWRAHSILMAPSSSPVAKTRSDEYGTSALAEQ